MNTGLFYKDKPIFGLDIGTSSLKVVEIASQGKKRQITGYGVTNYERKLFKDGVIEDPLTLAKATKELFQKNI